MINEKNDFSYQNLGFILGHVYVDKYENSVPGKYWRIL